MTGRSTVENRIAGVAHSSIPNIDHKHPRVPPVVYLRLEVRDEAGNLAIHERKEPIAIDQLRPSAKIREVRPVAKSGK
jgi:hypothetical protein